MRSWNQRIKELLLQCLFLIIILTVTNYFISNSNEFDIINLGTVGEPVSGKATKDFTGFLQIPGLRTRVPSYHVRELVR